MSCTSRTIIRLLAVLLFLAGRAFAATALGSITITGAEQSSGGTWDTGTVTATINGVQVSFAYGQFSTPGAIASALGALISQNCNMPIYAQATGATLTFYQKGSNTMTSASITSVSNNPSLFPSSSFQAVGPGGGSGSPVPQITQLSLYQGPPQMGFVITGSNFGSTGTVWLQWSDGLYDALTVIPGTWTTTSISVQIPPGAPQSSGNVVVTAGGNAQGVGGVNSTTNNPQFTIMPAFVCQ